MSGSYHEEQRRRMILKLRDLLLELPDFCFEYFRGIEPVTAERTRLGYAYDLKIFFHFLIENKENLQGKTLKDLTLEDLDQVDVQDLERFLEYLTIYEKENTDGTSVELQNGEKGKARKVAAIRSIFKYFYKRQKIHGNPATLIDTPKIHEKNIIRLEVDEIAKLLDEVDSGDQLTPRQKVYHKYTHARDLALMTVLLGTGMRVSECVGLNLSDIDYNVNGLKITRKGGNESVLYFGREVEDALKAYIEERKKIIPQSGHEDALFLSMQKRRITVRAVENIVKKYAAGVTQMKRISPHKLRSSYGTALYSETGDIYLVADVLGHKDVNTTRKHYAQMEDSRRRSAANAVILRQEKEESTDSAASNAKEDSSMGGDSVLK